MALFKIDSKFPFNLNVEHTKYYQNALNMWFEGLERGCVWFLEISSIQYLSPSFECQNYGFI